MQHTGTWYPKPRQVWQEPGTWPNLFGRRPGVPDKPADVLSTISRYFAQILNCFIAYIFPFSNSSVGWTGNIVFQDCLTMPSVHCDQNGTVTEGQANLIASLKWTEKLLQGEKPSGIYAIELMKLIGKGDTIHISGKVWIQDRSERSF